MFRIETFATPRLKPEQVAIPIGTPPNPARKHTIRRAVERRDISKYMRGHAYDEQNLKLAREILAKPERWEPFYLVYARAVVERLGNEGKKTLQEPSGWTA